MINYTSSGMEIVKWENARYNVTVANNWWICWQFNCKHLPIVSNVDIIWFNLKTPEKKIVDLEQVFYEIFLGRKSLFHFFRIKVYSRLWFIAARQSNFIVLYVWEIVVRKNLTNFEGCHFARFYILIWWSFAKIETKNFNSGSCFLKLVKLGTISPAAHFLNCVHHGRSQTIAAIICSLSSGKFFVKYLKI